MRDLYWHYSTCSNSPYNGGVSRLLGPAPMWAAWAPDPVLASPRLFWDHAPASRYASEVMDVESPPSSGEWPPPSSCTLEEAHRGALTHLWCLGIYSTADLTPRERDHAPFFQFANAFPLDLHPFPSSANTASEPQPPSNAPKSGKLTDPEPMLSISTPLPYTSASAVAPISSIVDSSQDSDTRLLLDSLASTFARSRLSSSLPLPTKSPILPSAKAVSAPRFATMRDKVKGDPSRSLDST